MNIMLWLLFAAALAASAQDKPLDVIPAIHTTIVITAKPIEPQVDRRNSEIFDRTLFGRDDQIFHVLDAGISAGQHEGGGKSVEIRRFGFNLDHGGVNGGLKVLVDNVQQNQGTQGHGQGYLGSLKSLTPELVEEVTVINGPFSAEYGDFSGLGVVHIRTRESLPNLFTARIQGGSFNSQRAFLAFSPDAPRTDALFAYEGAHTDGPFDSPARYWRHNLTTNFTRHLTDRRSVGFKFNGGLNRFYSSGQVPLDRTAAFGFNDASDGGDVRLGTAALYFKQELKNGDTLKLDGFLGRSLFDLYSNFTFFLKDPVHGDAFQQHDSRLQEGANAQYVHVQKFGILTAGANFHDNQINVGLYPRIGRVPLGVTTRANARVTNGAGYVQENVSLLQGRLLLSGGLRYDVFRFDNLNATRVQPKGGIAFTPTHALPVTFYLNYGRGISTADARGIVERPEAQRVATTDFFQFGTSHHIGRFSLSTDVFLIDRSNEMVYVPDDGSFEFKGRSRAYGYETKASVELTRHVSMNAGLTKVGNAFYRGVPRVYVDSAPHFTANAGLTLSNWKSWSGSVRMRAINHYRLDGTNASIVASGHTVFDMGLSRRIRRGLELSLSLDNFADRSYYETQNYFESRVTPTEASAFRIHATPGYPVTAMVGLTYRFRGK